MRKLLFFSLAGGLAQLFGGCAVYMPIQGAAPQITDQKQAELTASSYLNGRFEVAGAYSPVRHLLVRAAYSKLSDKTTAQDSTLYRGNQYELGAGAYFPLGPNWLVGGLGGFGQAHSEAVYWAGGSLLGFGRPVRYEYNARYNKVFGEFYGIFQASNAISLGAAYRITQVNFTVLTDAGRPVDFAEMARSEPVVFMRVRLGSGPAATRPAHVQLAWGGSATFGYDPKVAPLSSSGQLRQTRNYLTLGVSLFPHCLSGRLKTAPDKE